METINAIIVDDERNSRIVLRSLLSECPEIRIVGEAADANEAHELIKDQAPQLVFLDIQMPGGNAFNLLRRWDEIPFDVIFVTSYDTYAINAIKFSVLDYLLKPVETRALKIAVAKALKSARARVEKTVQILNLLNTINGDYKQRKLVVHVNDKVKLLTIDKISYIEASNNYCNITTVNGERYTTPKVLKDFEEFLADNQEFVRIHKSIMINTRHISSYTKKEPCLVTMDNGTIFEVARRKKRDVLERLREK